MLRQTLAGFANSGEVIKADATIGHKFRIFWATRSKGSAGSQPRDATALQIERSGLYHFPTYPEVVMKIGSIGLLSDLTAHANVTPAVPTFIEGLNNLRFLGHDIRTDRSWGTTLNMRCFRLPANRTRRIDLAGVPELALPELPFTGKFRVEYVQPMPAFATGTDKQYATVLDMLSPQGWQRGAGMRHWEGQ